MAAAGISKRGGRLKNEDYIGQAHQGAISCYVVADGLGGHGSGEIASQTAVKAVLDCFVRRPEISQQMLKSYLDYAQNAIVQRKEKDESCKNMGTTIVVLITDGKKAVWGHLGDSRLYRLRKKLLYEITDDHSVAFVSYQIGEIPYYSDIRNSPDQNKLLKILGEKEKYAPQISQVMSIDKHTKFLLCTDGFWKYVTEEDVEYTARKSKTEKEWLEKMTAIVEKNLTPTSDNYSAITVYFK
ncbi:MAG: PP2C family protein-serine/threonine phosphatase [Lachnospiraceae bacterium]